MAIAKFTLKATVAAVAAALSSGAFAVVDMNASPVVPVKFASEIVATSSAPATLTNAANALDLKVAQGYAMSITEVRYARVECSSNMKFAAAAVTHSNLDAVVGPVNGVGTNAIYFSITADTGALDATDTITVDDDRDVTSTSNVNCSYSLYDQPSQAQAGGSTGRIVNVADKAYIVFAPALVTTISGATHTADVEADPAYSEFTTGDVYADLATVNISDANALDKDGTTLLDSELLAADTVVTVTGDFSAAASVRLDANDNCSDVDGIVGEINSGKTAATFTIANASDVAANRTLCFVGSGAGIPVSTYSASVDYKASGAAYAVTDVASTAAGEITRNGIVMVSPMVQKPDGWLSRMVLVNNGGADRTYTVAALAEDGNTVALSGAAAGGTIKAGKTLVVDLPDLVATTGNPRTALVITVNGPAGQISGLYQIVNPVAGSISNHVMDYKSGGAL